MTRPRRASMVLLVASIAFSLGLAEAVVRIANIGPSIQIIFEENYQISDNPILEYELRPDSTYDGVTINSSGFRDREYVREKPPGVIRIAAIGDSVTFGLWVPQRASYPKQLEALLNESAPPDARFEVLNFGVTGYNVTQIVERLRTLALDYDPDLILYGYVLNDPQADSLEGNMLRDLRSFEQEQMSEQLSHGALRLMRHSRLLTLGAAYARGWGQPAGRYTRDTLTGNLVDRGDDSPIAVRARGDAGGAAYEAGDSTGQYFRSLHTQPAPRKRFVDGIGDLAQVARAANVPVLVAIFPLFLSPDSLDDYPLSDLHELVGAKFRENGLAVADLLPAYVLATTNLDAKRKVAVDFMHPSAYGHQIAAIELARSIGNSTH